MDQPQNCHRSIIKKILRGHFFLQFFFPKSEIFKGSWPPPIPLIAPMEKLVQRRENHLYTSGQSDMLNRGAIPTYSIHNLEGLTCISKFDFR